ncbi:hypothetical protein RI129_007282 [Pyrocoelia pectoralis]|uniref:Nuclease HARBI1 n=1 Tax=Pyrocoelia pectoralis TaxID=417401 RepID=A0AAN7V9E8_9COLE
MDDIQYIINLEHLEGIENEGVQIQRHNRYNHIDAFEILMEHQFIQIFRLSKDVCRYLIELVRPFMTPQRRATDLSVTVRVLVALRFFAAGSYQLDVGKNLFVAVSQPSVSRCIGEVSAALNQQEIFNRWVHFPRNFQELDAVRLGFYETFNFPGVVGLIDCTHIAIFTPHINDDEYPEHIYVNRKGYHSINVQLVCYSLSTCLLLLNVFSFCRYVIIA